MPKRTIVVPLDGSDFGRQIVPQICRVCDPANDMLMLVRVAEPADSILPTPPRPVSAAWTQPMYETARDVSYAAHPIFASQLEQSERDELEQSLLADKQLLEAAGFEVRLDVRFGDPAEEIAAAATQHAADMVAMATHGRSGLRQLLMGSVAKQVLRQVSIPVLLWRPFTEQLELLN